jgi:hypothetical protein
MNVIYYNGKHYKSFELKKVGDTYTCEIPEHHLIAGIMNDNKIYIIPQMTDFERFPILSGQYNIIDHFALNNRGRFISFKLDDMIQVSKQSGTSPGTQPNNNEPMQIEKTLKTIEVTYGEPDDRYPELCYFIGRQNIPNVGDIILSSSNGDNPSNTFDMSFENDYRLTGDKTHIQVVTTNNGIVTKIIDHSV